VWICNDRGQYLMTQRAEDKPRYPLYWEYVGGAVQKGETSLQGALREVEEEIGLRFRPEEAEFLFSQIRKTESGIRYQDINDVYRIRYNGAVSLGNALTKEVSQVKWMDAEEIGNLKKEGKLIYDIKNLEYFFTKFQQQQG